MHFGSAAERDFRHASARQSALAGGNGKCMELRFKIME